MTKIGSAAFTCSSVLFAAMSYAASATTVEVARKCDALVAKTFPSREPGNPAPEAPKARAMPNRLISRGAWPTADIRPTPM